MSEQPNGGQESRFSIQQTTQRIIHAVGVVVDIEPNPDRVIHTVGLIVDIEPSTRAHSFAVIVG